MKKRILFSFLLLTWFIPSAFAQVTKENYLWEKVSYQLSTPKGMYTATLDIGYTLTLQNQVQHYVVKAPETIQIPGINDIFTVKAEVTSTRQYQVIVTSKNASTPTITQGTLQWLWQWKEVIYSWPKLEGMNQKVYLGFLVSPQKTITHHTAVHEGKVLGFVGNEGTLTFTNEWPTLNYHYTQLIQFQGQQWIITSTLNETKESTTHIQGILPLTDTEILSEIIEISKSDTAITHPDLAKAILFAAKSYDIPPLLFTALIYQESKFNISDQSGDIQGPAQVSLTYAVEDCEEVCFQSQDFLIRYQKNSAVKPSKKLWNRYDQNLLYGAAYLRHLYLTAHENMPQIEEAELWKFLMVWYNFGKGDAENSWISAGRPTQWNKQFAQLLPEGEKRDYSGSIFFYFSKLTAGERNLRQFDAGESNASLRRAFITQFNN